MRIKNKKLGGHILIPFFIIVFIIVSLLIFLRNNTLRIRSQNESYIADATSISATHLNERFTAILDSIKTISAFTTEMLDSPDVDVDKIAALSESYRFDHIQYIPADGQDDEGNDLRDRKEYINGMHGLSGVCAVIGADIPGGGLFSFYTPLYYNNMIIGVLCGMYDYDKMQDILEDEGEFFGVMARTYLCASDGTVISSAGVENPPANILDGVKKSEKITGKSEQIFMEIFEKGESQSFEYKRGDAIATAYIAALDYNDWLLIQIFPPEASAMMRKKANYAGVVLVSSVIFAFLVYIAFLWITKRRKELSLINENKEISRIVESVTTLFSRFAVADLKNDSYYYVGDTDGIPPKGKYTDLVKYMCQFYIAEDDSTPMSELIAPEHIQEHMTKDVDYLQYEYHINRKSDKWEMVSLICLKRENGKPVSILYAVQNITERKKKDIESRIALQNAFDAAKAANNAKSQFLSRMSHDIRTPMNAVMGMTAVAAMHIDDRERLIDCLNKINTSSKHLLALINDILDMSKIESGKVTLSEEPFNLAEMTESIFTIMHPQIKAKEQKLSISTSNVVHEDVVGDTLRLRQVFVNILGNAVKFTPVGGSLSLEIREITSHIAGKAHYEFIFTDTGIGMDQAFIDQIFEPFSRDSNPDSAKIEGTGLGMPIAKNIVAMMDGDIKVESKRGEGSRFTVHLYLTVQDIGETDDSCLEDLKILVADDDKTAAENTREILSSIGMDATSVFGGEEAVEVVVSYHERGEDFAAVILDWQMPDKNGVQAAAEIRQRVGETVPIIILSAYDWSEIEQEARDTGVNAFIAKPLFRSRLVYVLKSLVVPSGPSEIAEIDSFTENRYVGKRVLLVEDNELNREVASELLNMIGVEVEMAFDGKIAVDTLMEKPENYYDLIFMDIQMPNMNGYEATKAIRASGREDLKTIPIVAMSADAFSDDVYRAKEAGMNDHVSKPVEIPKLSQALETWLKT